MTNHAGSLLLLCLNQKQTIMKILELFSGSRSIGKVAEQRGHEVFSVDNVAYPNTNWVGDIMDWDYRMNEINVGTLDELWIPDVLWASPPCTDFSVACIGKSGFQERILHHVILT